MELSHWLRPGVRGPKSSVEFGISFADADKGRFPVAARPLVDCPHTCKLMELVMVTFSQCPQVDWSNINVIARYYPPGSCLDYHIDRIDLFEDTFFTCVLWNDSNSALFFRNQQLIERMVE